MTHKRTVLTFTRRAAYLTSLLIIALIVLISLNKTAEMRSASLNEQFQAISPEQNVLLGKLAFARKIFICCGGSETYVQIANADGSAITGIGGGFPTRFDPAWSPDGKKIVHSIGGAEIAVISVDDGSQDILTRTISNERNPSWSALNKIAYERDNQIWVMDSDGSNQMQFPGIALPSPISPSWSPDGSKLAFASGGDIYFINADGTNQQRVAETSEAENNPSWSPDGTRLIFSKGTTGIFVINTGGTNETRLTDGNDIEPVWSQDNTKIAFVRRGAIGIGGLYTMDIDGANQVRIVTNTQNDEYSSPAWQAIISAPNAIAISGRVTRVGVGLAGAIINLSGSAIATAVTDSGGNYQFRDLPTGGNYTVEASLANYYFEPAVVILHNVRGNATLNFNAVEMCLGINCATNGKIAFVRSGEIFLMNPDGSNPVNLTNNLAGDAAPKWSPDGRKIVFTSSRDGNNELYTMNADGSGVVRLTNNAASDAGATFSPDGSKIVFVSDRDGNLEIYTINSDGSNPTRLTDNAANDYSPSFSPDSGKIVFISNRDSQFVQKQDIYLMNADSSNPVRLTNMVTNFPQLNLLSQVSFSPDGNKILYNGFDGSALENRAYTMNTDGTNHTLAGSFIQQVSYSPDGKKLVFVVIPSIFNSSFRGIWTKNINGSESRQLTFDNYNSPTDSSPAWQPLRNLSCPTKFDFDGDRRADISVYRPADGIWYLLNSQSGFAGVGFGTSNDKIVPADYNGNGRTDIAVWRENPEDSGKADYYILNGFDSTFQQIQFGATGDIPLSADFDGDGKADLAVYRKGVNNTQSHFFYRPSSLPGTDFVSFSFGLGDDKPVVADYDGDGRTDLAVFRPSNGVWYIQKSTEGFFAVQFGAEEDKPVTGDFDADGRADQAVFRPSNGVWYLLQSASGFGAAQFGIAEDKPTAADYDGDGKTDIAVYRPSNGVWYVLQSANGFTGVGFGITTDKPIENAFVP